MNTSSMSVSSTAAIQGLTTQIQTMVNRVLEANADTLDLEIKTLMSVVSDMCTKDSSNPLCPLASKIFFFLIYYVFTSSLDIFSLQV
jgi:hypothetical protein